MVIKPKELAPFSGKASASDNFFVHLAVNFAQDPSSFQSDNPKVLYAISNNISGLALDFMKPFIDKMLNDPPPEIFYNFSAFREIIW